MADLTARDRGQLMLVAALGLAVLFLALAVVVNTVIYTENLATRSSDLAGGADAIRYADAVEAGVGGLIAYANYHNNSSHGDLTVAVRAGTGDVGRFAGFEQAVNGRSTEVRFHNVTNGTRISQPTDAEFTDTSGTADWPVATNVTGTRRFAMNVDRSVLNSLGLSDVFRVIVDDGTSTWRLNVTEDGVNDIVIGVNDGNGNTDTCRVTASRAWVNLTAGTFGGEECAALDFGAGLSGDYDIRFENGDFVSGNYSLIVDNATLAGSPGPHLASPGSGEPFATHATYSIEARVLYFTPRLSYNTTLRIAPGEARV